jgi:hypothetical protein
LADQGKRLPAGIRDLHVTDRNRLAASGDNVGHRIRMAVADYRVQHFPVDAIGKQH